MVLVECTFEVHYDDLLQSTQIAIKVVSHHHWRGYIFDEIIDWSKVDEKSDIILGEKMSGDVCSLSLASQEQGTDRLYDYVVLLGYFKDSLVCEIITDLLHYSLEFMAVSGNGNLSGCGSLH